MTRVEDNYEMCRVGPNSKTGQLLRRYWHPVAAVGELDQSRTKPIQILDEELVLYHDGRGVYGLLQRHCPHRRADLSLGWVEECGLRCSYHGWKFDENGNCLEQPFDDTINPKSRFREHIRTTAYKVQEQAGLLWAYMGPEPAPLLPNWEPFTWSNGFIQIVISKVPCNWVQAQDNSIDPVHFEWLHDNWTQRLAGINSFNAPRHLEIAFDEFEYGFTYRRRRENAAENNQLWTIGRVCLWPNALFTGDHFEWRVPIDDNSLLSVGWFFEPVPTDCRPYHQDTIPYWYAPVVDSNTGEIITSHIMNQDYAAWVGQGTLSDRQNEHLGKGDRGVTMFRRRLMKEAELVSMGKEPTGVLRDRTNNDCIELPIIGKQLLVEGPTRDEFLETLGRTELLYGSPFPFLAKQPEAITKEYYLAMGIDKIGAGRPRYSTEYSEQ